MEATELNIIKLYLVVILYLLTHLYNHLCIAFLFCFTSSHCKGLFSCFCAYVCQRTLISAAFLNNQKQKKPTHMLEIQGVTIGGGQIENTENTVLNVIPSV